MFGYALLLILALSLIAYYVGRLRGVAFAGGTAKAHSLPSYHGAFVAVWVGIPAFVLILLWVALQGAVIDRLLLGGLPPSIVDGASPAQLNLVLSEIKNVAAGRIFTEPTPEIEAAARTYARWQVLARWAMLVVAAALMMVALVVARSRLSARFRARNGVERVLSGLMVFCALVAILTTIGIIASLVAEAWRFFEVVPVSEFLFGLRWEPQIALRADQVG
ncbi:MAG: phosphate ABC transporter permease family protein, partial [Propylenella sp.]